jgi:hypothetical protein
MKRSSLSTKNLCLSWKIFILTEDLWRQFDRGFLDDSYLVSRMAARLRRESRIAFGL